VEAPAEPAVEAPSGSGETTPADDAADSGTEGGASDTASGAEASSAA